MSVLTLAGKPIDWANPPKATDKVLWSRKTTSGKAVIGSLRTIAHLDRLDSLAFKKYGVHIDVMQGPFNTSVSASAGTHDFDACLDVRIPGVDWMEQQRFFRANGAGAYARTAAQGFTPHIHYFTLPEREGADVSDDYRSGGFRVGKYVDGGWSTLGARAASSQIEDYYLHKTALAGHAHDPSWFPASIAASIFDLEAYIARQRKATAPKPTDKRLVVQTTNIEGMKKPPLGEGLAEIQPDVAVLQQAAQSGAHLGRFGKYKVYGFRGSAEARGVKALVSRNSKVVRVRRLRMTLSWIGPKASRAHTPRVFQAIQVRTPFWVWVVNVHFPTGGPDGPNAKAWAESWRRTVKFLKKRRGVVIGDFNATAVQLRPLCEAEGFELTMLGKVDHAVSNRLHRVKKQSVPGRPTRAHGWGAVTYAPLKK